jgi:hypothetical protein
LREVVGHEDAAELSLDDEGGGEAFVERLWVMMRG